MRHTMICAVRPHRRGARHHGHERPVECRREIRLQRRQGLLIGAAEKMPAADYDFKSRHQDVRSIRSASRARRRRTNTTSARRRRARPGTPRTVDIDQNTLSKKDDLVAALKAAFAYCDSAYEQLTDTAGAEPVPSGNGRTRFGMLNWNLWHTWEHYGNVVVYLRLKGLVPPSSEKTR